MSLTKEGGLLVVVREVDKIWPTLPAVERARIVQYRGFDSRASWPDLELSAIPIEVVNNVADLSQYQAVREYVGIIQGRVREKVDLLLLRDIENKSICELSNTFTFIGYDVGVLNEFDEPVFSSIILHEIHKSGNSLVRDLHQSLNKFYLFSDEQDCKACLLRRQEGFQAGTTEGFETAYDTGQMRIVKVYLDESVV